MIALRVAVTALVVIRKLATFCPAATTAVPTRAALESLDAIVSVAPPANHYDFGFLAPCPCGGLMLHGDSDELVPSTLNNSSRI